MEEQLIEEVKELVNTLNNNTIPTWITILGIIIPIILSIAVIVQAWVQHRQNKKLQSYLSNMDIKAQMHSDFMNIYNDFCFAQKTLGFAGGRSYIAFSNFNTENGVNVPFNYVTELNTAMNTLFQAFNRAMLLIPEQETKFRDALKTILDKYKDLKKLADEYYYNSTALNISTIAWQQIVQEYPFIPIYNYQMLLANQQAYNTYLEKCKTETTTTIDDKTKKLIELFKYEKFDIYFEKYVRVNVEEVK